MYTVWKFDRYDDRYGRDYPERVPWQIIENLLWYYTEPFDVLAYPGHRDD